MNVCLWGTRGSLPATFTQKSLRQRITQVLELAQKQPIGSVEAFINGLPASLTSTFGTNTSCIEIRNPAITDSYLLCDAGTGIRDFAVDYMRNGCGKRPATFHILLTHLHWDHIQGFPFFTPAYIPGNRIIIHSYHHNTEEAFRKQMSPPCFPVPLEGLDAEIIFDIQPPCKPFEINGLKITSIQQNHPGVSYGYRFDKGDKSVVYSTDCEHTENAHEEGYPFVAFYKDADALIFDAMYSLADASITKVNWGHSSNVMGVKLAARAKVKHLIIFHHEPTCPDAELDRFLRNTHRYSEIYHKEHGLDAIYPQRISLAYDGMFLSL